MRLLVATTNAAKRTELEALLAGLPVELLTVRDFPDDSWMRLMERPES
ncbi:MAG: hypothetical protein ACYTFZ_05855 [Planctomycetota bacterium]|jgi:inosine/xanthosine triphosphate pyrophosphatase family protein